MFHLNDNFKKVLSPAKWRNRVSQFLNNLCGDGMIEVIRPDKPSATNPPNIRLNLDALESNLGADGIRAVPLKPFEMVAATTYNDSGSVTETTFKVYLPTLSYLVRINGAWFSITGCTAVSGETGWYTTGLTLTASGTYNVYLVDNSSTTANTAKFATSASGRWSVLVAVIVNGEVRQYHTGDIFAGNQANVLTALTLRYDATNKASQIYLPTTAVARINGEYKNLGSSTGWVNTGIALGSAIWLNEGTDGSITLASSQLSGDTASGKRRMSVRIGYVSATGLVTQYTTGFIDCRNGVRNDTDTNQQTIDGGGTAGTAWTRNDATGNLVMTIPCGFYEVSGGDAGRIYVKLAQMTFGPDGRLKSVGATSVLSGITLADFDAVNY